MSKRAVIFDMDGVLLRTDEYHYRSWAELAAAHGISFDRQVFDARMRGLERRSALNVFLERSGQRLSEIRLQELAAEKQQRFLDIVAREGVQPLAGVAELMADLRRHRARIGVGSSSRNTRNLLAATGLLDQVDAVVDANDAAGKPEPDIFLGVARLLNSPPAECVVIEDALDGVEAARRADMTVLGVGDRGRLGHLRNFVPSLAGITAEWVLSLSTE